MTAECSDGAAYADITAQHTIIEQVMGEFDVSHLVVLLTVRAQCRDIQLGDDTDEEDPFAEIDEGYEEDDLEANLQRDKYARLTSAINQLVDELNPDAPDFQIRDACDELVNLLLFCQWKVVLTLSLSVPKAQYPVRYAGDARPFGVIAWDACTPGSFGKEELITRGHHEAFADS